MALVLGGGGARGCYEIGMWQAFAQNNLTFDCVAGTSIGAIVGAIYTQQTLEPLVEFVCEMKPSMVAQDLFDFPQTFSAFLKERKNITRYLEKYILSSRKMDISPLKGAIAKMFDYDLFEKSPIDFACMTYNVTQNRPEAYFKKDMNPENAKDIILASASCYPAFPMMQMNGSDYIDGGYYSNVPIRLAMDMKADKILAVDVEGPGIVHPIPSGADVLMVKPILPLQNFLDFSNEQAIRSMNIGYLETCKLLGNYAGYLFTFVKRDLESMVFIEQYLSFMFNVYGIKPDEKTQDQIVRFAAGFHPSGLSETLHEDYVYGEMVEALAYLVKIEPAALYSYHDFMYLLLERLSEISKEELKTGSDFSRYASSLSKEGMIALIHQLIVQSEGQLNDMLRWFGGFFSSEFCLAYVWYFLEAAYDKAKHQ